MNEVLARSKQPLVLQSPLEVHSAVIRARTCGKRVGLVPTMGALHAGHLSLVHAAKAECDVVVATIFVNPAQFGPHEDFDSYPRSFESDIEALADLQVDLLFCPATAEVYPPGFSTYVDPPVVAKRLEGECRPGHFRGVATVVLKLFHWIPAHVAYFGEKDFQQSLMIEHMVRDVGLPIEMRVCPIVRDQDGLALSSRNRYLSAIERQTALALSESLQLAEDLVRQGICETQIIRTEMRCVLEAQGIRDIDYISICNPQTLEEQSEVHSNVVVLVAAYVGKTRLIDNRRIG